MKIFSVKDKELRTFASKMFNVVTFKYKDGDMYMLVYESTSPDNSDGSFDSYHVKESEVKSLVSKIKKKYKLSNDPPALYYA